MKSLAKSVLKTFGLLPFAKRVRLGLKARGFTPWTPLVPEQAFTDCASRAIALLRREGHQFGDYLEFGVSRGTSMACTWRALDRAGLGKTRLLGFDSFEGLAADAGKEGWVPGDFASTEAATRRYLASRGVPKDSIRLVKGWFKDTATPATREALQITKASIIMVDCDAYTPSREALWFVADLIDDHAVLLFDDWGWAVKDGNIGQKEAFDEFCQAFPQFSATPVPAYRNEARAFLVSRSRAADRTAHDPRRGRDARSRHA